MAGSTQPALRRQPVSYCRSLRIDAQGSGCCNVHLVEAKRQITGVPDLVEGQLSNYQIRKLAATFATAELWDGSRVEITLCFAQHVFRGISAITSIP